MAGQKKQKKMEGEKECRAHTHTDFWDLFFFFMELPLAHQNNHKTLSSQSNQQAGKKAFNMPEPIKQIPATLTDYSNAEEKK